MTEATEFRVVGPPGSGKTTFLSREVVKAAQRYGSEAVMVTSLTRTAAAEVAGRDVPINPDRIGTLHAHSLRALGFPKLAETREAVEAWNKENSIYALTIPGSISGKDDGFDSLSGNMSGDKHFAQVNIARARRTPLDELPSMARRFWARWKAWKEDQGLLDWTDLIDFAGRDVYQAPGMPKVIFVDEAQDHDRLELDLVRKWGSAMRGVERLVIVGDPDQNLYEWRGSDPEAFFETELPDENKLVLTQSYRLSHAVWAKSIEWIERIPNREQVEYWPTDEPGDLRKITTSLRDPAGLLRDAQRYIDDGKSVMFLTACAYMIDPLKNEMRAHGIPFHNPYRKRSDWNPLSPTARGTTTLDKFRAYISPLLETEQYAVPWSVGDVQVWTQALARVLKRNARTRLDELDPGQGFTLEMLEEYFDPRSDPVMAYNIEAGDPKWFQKHMKAGANVDYAVRVLSKFGAEAIEKEPQIQIGTIHSVKGGEADVVYLFPDVSRLGYQSIQTPRGKASTIRQFYVGMTRARETLILAGASSQTAIQLGS